MYQKIFVIGFNKTATSTIHNLFIINNLSSFHHTNWTLIWDDENYDCFSDNGNFQNIEKLYNKYDNAIFILNLRELDKWLISRVEHGIRTKETWSYNINDNKIIDWVSQREKHYQFVLEFFKKDKKKLIILDTTKKNWIEYISKKINVNNTQVDSLNIHPKSINYEIIVKRINNILKCNLKLNNEQQKSKLLINDSENDVYLKLYENNLN